MKLAMADADYFVPDSVESIKALQRTTHLGIGAHQDDLEFMALHGIQACYDTDEQWFGGVVCTNGAGSARSGLFKDYSDEAMIRVRTEEQREAARIGKYGFITQLAYPSSIMESRASRESLVQELATVLQSARPEVVYTHNPFDRHPTHIGVLLAVLEAMECLPEADRPRKLIGCEVWRSLDWLPDEVKLIQPLDVHPGLASRLNGVFASQIAGGKRYDLAVEGRRLANATFTESHSTDRHGSVAYAIDLTALTQSGGPDLKCFSRSIMETFSSDVEKMLEKHI